MIETLVVGAVIGGAAGFWFGRWYEGRLWFNTISQHLSQNLGVPEIHLEEIRKTLRNI